MTFHDPLVEYLTSESFLGNTYFDYILSLILFISTFLILEGIRLVFTRKLSRMEKVQSRRMIKISVLTVKNYLSRTISFLLALYFASQYLEFNPVISSGLEILVLAIISWLILKLALNLLNAIIEYQQSTESGDIHILEFFRVIVRAFLILIILLWFLTEIGLDVTSFLASLGILSLAVAFALKEILADIFASLVIFIDRPFEVGDAIKVENDAGVVEKIGIRSSRIRSGEGHIIVASNRDLTSKRIHNLKRMNQRRVSLKIQISQETPKSVIQKVPELVKDLVKKIEPLRFDKINLSKINDFSYDYELVYFVKTRDFKPHVIAKQELLIGLLEKFEEMDIMIPYPTKTVILEEV